MTLNLMCAMVTCGMSEWCLAVSLGN